VDLAASGDWETTTAGFFVEAEACSTVSFVALSKNGVIGSKVLFLGFFSTSTSCTSCGFLNLLPISLSTVTSYETGFIISRFQMQYTFTGTVSSNLIKIKRPVKRMKIYETFSTINSLDIYCG